MGVDISLHIEIRRPDKWHLMNVTCPLWVKGNYGDEIFDTEVYSCRYYHFRDFLNKATSHCSGNKDILSDEIRAKMKDDDQTGFGVFMFYDLILPDEKIDHVVSFDAEGTESSGTIEFSMKIRIHDHDKAMEIYNAFVDRYSEGAQGSEFFNLLRTYDQGVKIRVNDSESRIVCYKKGGDNVNNYWLIYVSEDY